MWSKMGNFRAQRAQAHDGLKENDLPVKSTWHGKVAANPTVDAEVYEGREVPNLFRVGGKCAELPGYQSSQQVVGQRGPLAMEKRGQGQERASRTSCDTPCQHGEDKRCLKGEICGYEGRDRANPHPNHHGDADPKHDLNLLLERAIFAKEQRLELDGADEGARHCRRYAYDDQQINRGAKRVEHRNGARLARRRLVVRSSKDQ